MSDTKVEKWTTLDSDHEAYVFDGDTMIATTWSEKLAERIARLPMLEDEHRRMKALLEEVYDYLHELNHSNSDIERKIYILLAEMDG